MPTAELFYSKRETNQFDKLVVDVDKTYKTFPVDAKFDPKANKIRFIKDGFHRLYSQPLLPLAWCNYAWHLLRRIQLDWTWFQEFRTYWSTVLGGRPLWGPQDFYFLRGTYRAKHQDNVLPDTEDASTHLEAWQRPELIFQLFHQVYYE